MCCLLLIALMGECILRRYPKLQHFLKKKRNDEDVLSFYVCVLLFFFNCLFAYLLRLTVQLSFWPVPFRLTDRQTDKTADTHRYHRCAVCGAQPCSHQLVCPSLKSHKAVSCTSVHFLSDFDILFPHLPTHVTIQYAEQAVLVVCGIHQLQYLALGIGACRASNVVARWWPQAENRLL